MKVLSSLLIAALGVACATTDGADEVTQASSTGASCANPTAYGAILNDGGDDTVPIQAAICAALCPTPPSGCGACSDPTLPGYGSHAVCLPGGELDATRPPMNKLKSFLLAGVNGLTIYGEGPASVLAMHGPGSVPCANSCSGLTACPFHDWNLFQIENGSQHIEFRDLTLTSTGVDGFDKDSTRFIQFGDQTTNTDDLLIKNTRMIDSCGDHLYLIGSTTASNTLGVRVLDSTLGNAIRRAIVVKHGIRRAVFSNNTFATDGGAIDFDASAAAVAASEMIITGNSFRTTGAASLVLAGESSLAHVPASRVVVANNVMFGYAIFGGGLHSLEIRNNTIVSSQDLPEINLSNGLADHLDISHNTIIRGSATAASAILVNAKELTSPDVRITGNTIVQASKAPAIVVTDVADHAITNNVIAMTWTDAAKPVVAGIQTGTDHFNVASSQVSGNSITAAANTLTSGILVNITSSVCDPAAPPGSPCPRLPMHFGALQANRNLVVGARSGITIGVGTVDDHKTGSISQLPMIANNDFAVSNASAVNIAGVPCDFGPGCILPAYVIGGNQGSTLQLVGTGDPTTNSVAAPNGSIYMMRGGTASGSAALFFRANNTWVAQ